MLSRCFVDIAVLYLWRPLISFSFPPQEQPPNVSSAVGHMQQLSSTTQILYFCGGAIPAMVPAKKNCV